MIRDTVISATTALAFMSFGAGLASFIGALAHAEDQACECPEPEPCPPEGFTLVSSEMEDTTMQEALDAIRAAREMTQE